MRKKSFFKRILSLVMAIATAVTMLMPWEYVNTYADSTSYYEDSASNIAIKYTWTDSSYTFNGTAQYPSSGSYTVLDTSGDETKTLTENTHYTVSYADSAKNKISDPSTIVDAGDYYVVFAGNSYGGYSFTSIYVPFKINQADIGSFTVEYSKSSTYYTPDESTGSGSELSPEFIFYNSNGYKVGVTQDTDYSVTYTYKGSKGISTETSVTAPTAAGLYVATITGSHNFYGTTTKDVYVTYNLLSDYAHIVYTSAGYTYDGAAHMPGGYMWFDVDGNGSLDYSNDVVLFYWDGEETNDKMSDTSVINSANHQYQSYYSMISPSGMTNNGSYTISFTGNTYLANTYSLTYQISKRNLSTIKDYLTVTISDNLTYNGSSQTPQPVVKLEGGASSIMTGLTTLPADLTRSVDYTYSATNNTNAGTATMIITGNGNYTGTITQTYTINEYDISGGGVTVKVVGTAYYTGSQVQPTLKVTDKNNNVLTEGKDYNVDWDTNTTVGAGAGSYTLTGIGNYTGTVPGTFDIYLDISEDLSYDASPEEFTYNATPQYPAISLVKKGDKSLAEGTDYTLSYYDSDDNEITEPWDDTKGIIEAGDYYILITAVSTDSNGNDTYTRGEVKVPFTIDQLSITDNVYIQSIPDSTYVGGAIKAVENYISNEAESTSITGNNSYFNIYSKTLGKDHKMRYGTDYTVTYSNNTNAGTATVTFTGNGSYTGTATSTFTIKPADINDVLEIYKNGNTPDYGTKGIPKLLGVQDAEAATDTTNTTKYHLNVDATGSAYYYNDGNSVPATVTMGSSLYNALYDVNTTYDINNIYKEGTDYNNVTLVQNTDFTLSFYTCNDFTEGDGKYFTNYPNMTSTTSMCDVATPYYVTLTGTGNYTGTLEHYYYYMVFYAMSDTTVALSRDSYEYNGKYFVPKISTLRDSDGEAMTAGKDYLELNTNENDTKKDNTQDATDYSNGKAPTYSYANNQNAGTASVYIIGWGEYLGTLTATFKITRKDLSDFDGELDKETYEYTGDEIYAVPTVTSDSSVSYYSSTAGDWVSPTELKQNTDYTVGYTNNKETTYSSGAFAYCNITGIGNFTGSFSIPFYITRKDVSELTISLSSYSYTYTGYAIEPDVTVVETINDSDVALEEGTHYSVSYSNNTDAGQGTVTVKGKGDYTGTTTLPFAIHAVNLADLVTDDEPYAYVTLSETEYTYDGDSHIPELESVTLESGYVLTEGENADYTVTYPDEAIDAGTYYVTITAGNSSNVTGSAQIPYVINPLTLSGNFTASVSPESTVYDTVYHTPTVSVYSLTDSTNILDVGTDYTWVMTDSDGTTVANSAGTVGLGALDVGTYTVTVTGTGNYTDTVTATYSITSKTLTDSSAISVTLADDKYNYSYTSAEIKPTVVVTYTYTSGDTEYVAQLTEGTDYKVTYSNNINVGTATATVTALSSNYTGSASVDFTISALNVGTATSDGLTVSAIDSSNIYYTSEAIEPSVTAAYDYGGDSAYSLVSGTDYSLSYSNNINAGTATVTMTGLGNFTGSYSQTFNINKRPISEVTITGIDSEYSYTGSEIVADPEPVLTLVCNNSEWGGKSQSISYTLVSGVDYNLSYSDNKSIGTATAKFTALEQNFTGETSTTFNIVAKSIASADVTLSPTSYVYDGDAHVPTVSVYDSATATTLTEGTDYELHYYLGSSEIEKSGCVNVNTYIIRVLGLNNYANTYQDVSFKITALDLTTKATASLASGTVFTYNGDYQEPTISVSYNSVKLTEGTDYTISYYAEEGGGEDDSIRPKDANQYYATVNFMGNYKGAISGDENDLLAFTINPLNITNLAFVMVDETAYTGVSIEDVAPSVGVDITKVTLNNYSTDTYTDSNGDSQTAYLLTSSDYSLTYYGDSNYRSSDTIDTSELASAGTYYVGITGKGNFEGYSTTSYTITAADLSAGYDISIGSSASPYMEYDYTGYSLYEQGVTPYVYVSGDEDMNPVFITDSDEYDDDYSLTYYSVIFDDNGDVASKTKIKNGLSAITDVGDYMVTVSGNNTNCTNSFNAFFSIVPADISGTDFSVTASGTSFMYTGDEIEPSVTVIQTVYAPNSDDADSTGYVYNTLTEDTDYYVSYADNVDMGTSTASITVTGDDTNYKNSKVIYFSITAAYISHTQADYPDDYFTVTLDSTEYDYTGSEIEPSVTVQRVTTNSSGDTDTVTLTATTDYTVVYTNNINIGTGTVTVTGTGNYKGTRKATFTIQESDEIDFLDDTQFNISGIASSYTYTGSEITPEPVITTSSGSRTLELGTHYLLTYEDNIDVGTATITITGTGTCSGSATVTFNITAYTLTSTNTSVSPSTYTYTGSAITPTFAFTGDVSFTEGSDYELTYYSDSGYTTLLNASKDLVNAASTAVNVGTYYVSVSGINNCSGTVKTRFYITAADISTLTAVLAGTSYTYTGTAITPKVTISGLTQDTDFTVTYSNNVSIGTASVIITGKGNYTGTQVLTFEIISGSSSINSNNATEVTPIPTNVVSLSVSGMLTKGASVGYNNSKYTVTGSNTLTLSSTDASVSGALTIPESLTLNGTTYYITKIAAKAFKGCDDITSVNIKNSKLVSIGKNAFSGCTSLKKFTCTSTKLKTIGKAAFKNCSKLKTVTLKTNSLKSVGKNAFKTIANKATIRLSKKKYNKAKTLITNSGIKSSTKFKKTS